MRRHANASPAGPNSGGGESLGLIRRAFAPRGVLGEVKGSDAPSSRRMLGFLAGITALLLVALLPASASATDYSPATPPSICTATGSAAGQCEELKSVAVDQSTGMIYVVDAANLRIDQFEPNGTFVRAFGWNVRADVSAGEPNVCTSVTGCKKGFAAATVEGGQIGAGSRGIAVDPGTHFVYVVTGVARISYFDGTTGEYVATLTGTEGTASPEAPEKFAATAGVAVDTSDSGQHYLWVAINVDGQSKTLLHKYKVAGPGGTPKPAYVCQITGTETPSKSLVAAAPTECPGGPSKDGAFNGFRINGQVGGNLAVDPGGNVYVAEEVARSVVSKFDSAGHWKRAFAATNPRAVATGVSGQLYVAVTDGSPAKTHIKVFNTANGNVGADFGTDTVSTEGSLGIAVYPGSPPSSPVGTIYVADKVNKKLWAYVGAGGIEEPPTIEEEKSEEVTGFSAKLVVKINPHNSSVNAANATFFGYKDCEFEYTTDANFKHGITNIPCENPSNLGSGEAGVITSLIIGSSEKPLIPKTKYYWRAYAANEATEASYVVGAIENFTTKNAPASASTDPVGAIGETTATLNGHVNNNGAASGSICVFEVTLKADTGFASPVKTASCGTVSGSGSQAVSAIAAGLNPNTEYIYRVTAQNEGNRDENEVLVRLSTDLSPPLFQPFTTSAAPTIIDQGVVSTSETGAVLGAHINPNGLATTHHLEYVDGATFQADQPEGFEHAISTAESASIGSDHTSHEVTTEIEELQPETTYHYRFVAYNTNGTTEAPARAFVTGGPIESNCANETLREENASTALPECRAYEMVTPPDKNFGTVDEASGAHVIVAWNGEGVSFCTSAQFGDPPPENGSICNTNYVSQRTPGGWRTRAMVPNYCPRDFNDPNNQTNVVGQAFPSPNLDLAVISRPETPSCTAYPALAAHSLEPGSYLYREDLRSDPTAYDLLTPESNSTSGYSVPAGAYAGANDNFSRIVYQSGGNQIDDPAIPAGVNRLFEWHDGTLSLVSREPGSNAPFATPSSITYPLSGASRGFANAANAVSADGSRIFFQTPVDAQNNCAATDCEIYLREGAAATYWVSEQECSPACSNTSAPDKFEWATPSGSKAFFATTAKLKNEDTSPIGNDLYMFTKGPNPAVEPNLTLLTKDNEPADGTNAEVLGVIGIADDGDTVYFAAGGQIVAGAPHAPATPGPGVHVYRWRWNGGSPSVEYLATLKTPATSGEGSTGQLLQDGQNWSASENGSSPGGKPVSSLVTPNGADLLIQTVKPLDPFADRDTSRDIYRWSEGEGWVCLSCQAPGAASAGESSIDVYTAKHDPAFPMFRMSNELHHPMSDDGSRVFFGTKDALVPQDTNGLEDVYEWHDGTVSLISTGTGTKPATLIGASRDGYDVFFDTSGALVGWDTDGATDYYDARIGGGFTAPPPPPAPCEEGTCPGQGTSAPAPSPAGSASHHQGAGNPTPKRCKKGLVLKHGKCVRKKHKKHKRHHKRQARQAGHNRRAGK